MLKLSRGTFKFFKFGVPLLGFVLAGSFGLAEFTDIQVRRREERSRQLTADEALKFQKKLQKPKSAEEIHQEMQAAVDIDKWENIRGPRVWEKDTLSILPSYKKDGLDKK